MTRREKALAMCVGGAVGVLILVYAVSWAVFQPFQSVGRQIADEQARRRNLQKQYQQVENIEDDWKKLVARTLAERPQDSLRRFQEDMQKLVALHGLRDAKFAPGSIVKSKEGFYDVQLRVSAAGTLKDILGFLCDFYCRDYLARLDKVSISADQAVLGDVNNSRPRASVGVRPGRPGAPSGRREHQYGPDGPVLKLSASAVTLVLPKLRGVDSPTASEIVELSGGRLQRERAAYNAILDHNPFMPYQPPVAVVTTPTTEHNEVKPPQPTPTVAVDPRAGADQKFVRVTTCLDGEPEAWVYDEQHKDQAPEKFHLDERIDDGRLLLIHPRGLVVRVGKQDYFYPLGKSFKDREKLDPDEQPEVWDALRQETVGSHPEAAQAGGDASG